MLLFQFSVFGFTLYLSLFPSLILSLTINNPPHIVSDANPVTVNIEWLQSDGDPPSIGIQILCGTVPILQPLIDAQTSVHGKFINNVNWDGNTFKGTCRVQAYGNSNTLLAQSPSFLAPALPGTTSTPSPSPSPSPSTPPIPTIPTSPPPEPTSSSTTSRGSFPDGHTSVGSSISSISSIKVTSTSTAQKTTTSVPFPSTISSSAPSSATVLPTSIFEPPGPGLTTNTTTTAENSSITNASPGSSSPAMPISTSTGPTASDNHGSHKPNLAAILGGVFGSIVFLVLFLFLLRSFIRHRRSKKTSEWMNIIQSRDRNNVSRRPSVVSSFFPRNILNPTPDPMTFDHNIEPESGLERFNQIQQEMREARIQRDLLRSNLENHTGTIYSRTEDTQENDFSENETEVEQELRQQYDRLSALVLELEAQLREVELPPDYTSSGHV